MKQPTNTQVVGGFNRKEKWALAHIYEEFRAVVYELSRRLLKNDTDAEDLTADVFEKLMNHPQRKENIKEISDFLKMTTLHLVIDKKRKQAVERSGTEHLADAQSFITEDEIKRAETAAVLWYYIYLYKNKLQARCLQVFELHYVHQKSIREIAQEMKISEKTAFNCRAIALRRMRLEIAPLRPILYSITLVL